LLREAVEVDPSHEEAALYLAFIDAHEGRSIKAAEAYRAVFDSAVDEVNRGLAIVQLGLLYLTEGQYKKAATCFRWVTTCGLADRDDRFWFARFNLGMVYANWQRADRSLSFFRELLDRHPSRVEEVGQAFLNAPKMRAAIDGQAGFAEALVERCPELFHGDSSASIGNDS
jgi:tetratricopeptide (TPR) repeat protein